METVLRVALIYVFVLFSLRVMGKREFSQLSPLELVSLLLIPELSAQALVREDFSLVNALIALSTLFALVFISTLLQYHSDKAARLMTGTPSVLVSEGSFVTENLNEERVGPDEIYSEMHKAGFAELSQIRWAILETDGSIAIVPYGEGSGERTNKPDERVNV